MQCYTQYYSPFVTDFDECANSPCTSGFDCLNLMSSYTCLPSVTLDPGSPTVLVNMSGGDLVRFQLSFQDGGFFSSLTNLIDGKYYLNISYGPASGPSIFAANNLSLTLNPSSSNSYDGTFQTSSGYGADLHVQLQWTLASNWNPGASFSRTGYIASNETFRYPSPSLTLSSLRSNSSSLVLTSGNLSYVNVPSDGKSYWVTFSGSNFGQFPDQVSVSYKNSSLSGTTFPCATSSDPTVVNGPVGSVLPSSIVCRTATAEPSGEYFITVVVAGQTSMAGLDKLIFPTIPLISSVSGCESCADEDEPTHTCNCRTSGGVNITITGSNFGQGMEAYVASLPCLNPILLATNQLTCNLPAGTGKNVALTVLIRTTVNDVLQSPNEYIISYAAPVITIVTHSNCQPSTSSTLNLVDCPRAGGGKLTITGQNFGSTGVVVLVGSEICGNLVHVPSSNQAEIVQCTLPSGIATNLGLIFIQSGGSLSAGDATVSYVQCDPGTFQNGLDCSSCEVGRYSATIAAVACVTCEAGKTQSLSGQTVCSICDYGKSKSSASTETCSDCEAGKYTSTATTLFVCADCEVGKVQPAVGSTGCVLCATGRYAVMRY